MSEHKSAIVGRGYGDSHAWRYVTTTAGRASLYKCEDCGANFAHHYPSTPDIFKALKAQSASVPDKCPARTQEVKP